MKTKEILSAFVILSILILLSISVVRYVMSPTVYKSISTGECYVLEFDQREPRTIPCEDVSKLGSYDFARKK